jgi:hypothetical protein
MQTVSKPKFAVSNVVGNNAETGKTYSVTPLSVMVWFGAEVYVCAMAEKDRQRKRAVKILMGEGV